MIATGKITNLSAYLNRQQILQHKKLL